jgi:hypothetical protein
MLIISMDWFLGLPITVSVQPLLGLRVQINQLALQFKEYKMLPSMLKPNGDCTVLHAGFNTNGALSQRVPIIGYKIFH